MPKNCPSKENYVILEERLPEYKGKNMSKIRKKIRREIFEELGLDKHGHPIRKAIAGRIAEDLVSGNAGPVEKAIAKEVLINGGGKHHYLERAIIKELILELITGGEIPGIGGGGNWNRSSLKNLINELISGGDIMLPMPVPTPLNLNGQVTTFQATFTGATNVRNNSNFASVTTKLLTLQNHSFIQHEPFSFTLGSYGKNGNSPYVQMCQPILNANLQYSVQSVCRLILLNSNLGGSNGLPLLSYNEVLPCAQSCNPCCSPNPCNSSCSSSCGSGNNMISYNNQNGSVTQNNQTIAMLRIYVQNNNSYTSQIGDMISVPSNFIGWAHTFTGSGC